MRSLWVAGLLLRRIRAERGMLVLLFAVIAATSFLFAAAPRLFNRISDDALRYAVRTSSAVQRNLVLALVSNISPGTGGVSAVRAEGEQLAAHFPPSVDTLIIERSLRITTARFSVTDPPSYDTFLSLRYQDGMTDATRLVSGRWPVDRGVPLRSTNFGVGSDQPSGGEPAEPVVLEAALATAEAAEIGVKVGDRLVVTMDPSDLAGTQFEIAPSAVQIVGLYEPRELSAEYWSGDASLLHISQAGTPDHPVAYATAYIPAEMYPSLAQDGMPFRYEWHFTIDPQRLDAGRVGELQDGLRHLDFVSAASEIGEPGTVEVRTGLLPILDDYVAQRAAAESILSVAAIGPIGLAGGVLGMVAILVVTRRRAALTLARSRGASGRLVLGTQLWEAIVLAGVALLIGLLAAVLVIRARDSPLSSVLAVAVGATAILLLLGATWPMAQRPLGRLGRADPPVLHVSPRRLVTELTIVGIAIGGMLLLRQRGLTAAGETGSVASFDPLLAAVPALSGLAAGVIALRLYPLPIRSLGWLAARRRDLVPVLGLRTIGRHPTAANLPLLVLMLTAAFGAFSSVIMSTIDHGQVYASYLEVGADYRIEKIGAGSLGSRQDLAASGVAAEALGILDPSADFASNATQRATIYLDAVDPRAYQEVAAGSPADPRWPDAFLGEPTGNGIGTEENPIPAILSPQLPVGSSSLVSGNTFRITIAGQEMTFRLIQRRAIFPGIGEPGSFAVVPFNWVQAAFANRDLRPSVMWLRARQPIGLATLAATVAEVPSSIRVISRYDAYAALHDPPMGTAVSIGYGLALGVAAIYMALAIIGAVVLSAVRRTQDLAYLRTLGVTPSQALGLALVEHAPPVLLALLPGAALGIGVAFLLEPGLQLDPFVGTSGVPLFVDWSRVALLVAALTGVVLAAVTVGTWLSRRARLVNVSRMGED